LWGEKSREKYQETLASVRYVYIFAIAPFPDVSKRAKNPETHPEAK